MQSIVTLSLVLVCGAYVYKKETDHLAHLEHLRHENDGVLPQPPEYEYLNMRRKPYPWGKNSLFFNPEASIHLPPIHPLPDPAPRCRRTLRRSRLFHLAINEFWSRHSLDRV